MRNLTEREQQIMDDETITIETKMKQLRMMSATFWTVEALSERFNITRNSIQKLLSSTQN